MINIKFFWFWIKKKLLKKHFEVVYASYWFIKNIKNPTSMGVLKLV